MLDCLAAQTLPEERFEVIIGDDGSRPDLAPTAAAAGRVRVISGPPRTSYAARNAAARRARGAALAFCDSDCLPEPTWLELGLAALEGVDIVAGEVRFQVPARPTIWSLLTIDLFLDQQQNVKLSRAVTANLFIRRSLFEELQGFDESLPSGGDYELVGRAVSRGARLRHAPQAAVGHPTTDKVSSFLRKIWKTNYADGVRRGRSRQRMDPVGILILVPVLGAAIARRRAFRPIYSLDTTRLGAAAQEPGFGTHLLAVAALYSLVCGFAGAGRVLGWLKGIRLALAGARPVYSAPPSAAIQTDTAPGERHGDHR